MLVPSMNNKEITEVITKDMEILYKSSTLSRLTLEYYMERKKAKVSKDAVYSKFYEVKAKSKNKWIIKISKDHFSEKFNTPNDTVIMLFVYYYTEFGIRVFGFVDDDSIVVYNGHLFSRYRERMKLNIPGSLEIVKTYLDNNWSATYRYMPEKDGKINFLGLIKEGFILGDYIVEDRWYVYKTFINKITSGFDANEFEKDALKKIKDELRDINKEMDNDEFNVLIATYRALIPDLKQDITPS